MKKILFLLITVLAAISIVMPVAAQSISKEAVNAEKVRIGEVIKPKLEEMKSLHSQAADLREKLKASKITFSVKNKAVRELLKPYRSEISAIKDSQLSLAGEMVNLRVELKAAKDSKDADKASQTLDNMLQIIKQKIGNLEKLLEIRGDMQSIVNGL